MKIILFLICTIVSLGIRADEPLLMQYQIFLATLSHKSVTAQVKILSNESYDEKKLLQLLNTTGAEIVIPTKILPKNRKWIDYRLLLKSSLTLDQAPSYHDLTLEKIEKLELSKSPTELEPERALARALFERELLSHLIKSSEYQSLEEGRQKLKDFGAR